MHKAGFVNIIGLPNAGKSTLLNAFLKEHAAIISPKPQTTRHRLKAMINTEDYQLIFSDTPGYIDKTHYKMQESMNRYVEIAMEDADVILFLITPEEFEPWIHPLSEQLKKTHKDTKIVLVLNKVDLLEKKNSDEILKAWNEFYPFVQSFAISALNKVNIDPLLDFVVGQLPEHPPYYPKEEWTDKSERFFTAELIREQILLLYHQEIPYSVEVAIESFKRGKSKNGDILRISSSIYTTRRTQKAILIGQGGAMIKELGIRSRKSIEEFFGERVHLELLVKSRKDWRNNEQWLKSFGYE